MNFLLIGNKIIEKINDINMYANKKLNFQNKKISRNPKKIVKNVLVFFFMLYYFVKAYETIFAPIFNASNLFSYELLCILLSSHPSPRSHS